MRLMMRRQIHTTHTQRFTIVQTVQRQHIIMSHTFRSISCICYINMIRNRSTYLLLKLTNHRIYLRNLELYFKTYFLFRNLPFFLFSLNFYMLALRQRFFQSILLERRTLTINIFHTKNIYNQEIDSN